MAAYTRLKLVLAGAAAALTLGAAQAEAQSYFCSSLQADYLSAVRQSGAQGGGDLRQQLAAARAAARRAGCQRFLFFGPRPSKQCPALLARVDQLQAQLMREGGGGLFGFGFFNQQSAARERDRLRDTLLAYGCDIPSAVGDAYRTICVRTCDGYYFPISSNATRSRFKLDAAVCQSMYPGGGAELYVHHFPGEDANQAVSLSGERYEQQSFAFTYRNAYDATCAATFKGGNPAMVASTRPPASPEMVAAWLTPPQSKGKPAATDEEAPDAAAAEEAPPDVVPEGTGEMTITGVVPEKTPVRTIGPSYYYQPNYYASSGGPPPKVPGYQPAAGGDRQVPVRELPPNPPVAASIFPKLPASDGK